MEKHVCTICNASFEYASYLQRHYNKKTKCIVLSNQEQKNEININTTELTNKASENDVNTIINLFVDMIKKNINDPDDIAKIKKVIKFFKERKNKELKKSLILQKKTEISPLNNITETDIVIPEIQETPETPEIQETPETPEKVRTKKYNCCNCTVVYSSSKALYNHIKLGRCKNNKTVTSQLQVNIEGSTADDINITNNNNTINNNITNNNINNTSNVTININAFGCESLDHISILDFKELFNKYSNLNKILYNLSNLIYIKNNNNMNFIKNNLNKNIVSYLASDMEIKTLSERDFIVEFEKNIKNLCIELFHIHKNELSIDDIVEYMKSFLLNYEIIYNSKQKLFELNEQFKSIMDCVFRNDDVKLILKNIEKDLLLNKDIKNDTIKKNKKRNSEQSKIIKEFNKPIEVNYIDVPDTTLEIKNLHNIKVKALKSLYNDKKNIISIF
jgi:hypothetical protein